MTREELKFNQAKTDLAFKKALIECLNNISYYLWFISPDDDDWEEVEFNFYSLEVE